MPGPPGSASHVPSSSDFSSDQFNEEIVDNLNWALTRVPWGPLATPASMVGTVSTTTTVVDVGLSVTFTQTAGRRIKCTIRCIFYSTVAGDGIGVLLTDGSNNIIREFQIVGAAASVGDHREMSWDESPAAGSITRKVRIYRWVGSGTVNAAATAERPAQLSVEDIGPA